MPRPDLSEDERTIASGVRWLLTGNAQQRALIAWHMGWPDAQRASGDSQRASGDSQRASGDAQDASVDDWEAFFLGHLLGDPYPAVRYIAERSLRDFSAGKTLSYDFLAPEPERAKARTRVMSAWKRKPPAAASAERGAALLRSPSGEIDRQRFERLAAMRDDREMDLRE